jgi:hypothetical protein
VPDSTWTHEHASVHMLEHLIADNDLLQQVLRSFVSAAYDADVSIHTIPVSICSSSCYLMCSAAQLTLATAIALALHDMC